MSKHKGIYKRGRIWWIMYAAADGRTRWESSRSTSFKDAQDLLTERRKAVLEGNLPARQKRIRKHTFHELAEHYLAWAQRQKGFKSKRGFIKQLINDFNNSPLRSFSIMAIEEWQTERLTANKPATVNRLLATLKHMFTKAVEWNMVEDDALTMVRKIKLLPENNRRLRYLSVEECQILVEACTPHLQPIVITALHTGMRKEEILSLQWDKHVDLKHGFILLDKTKGGGRREIPIDATLRETLESIPRRIDSPWVFVDASGRRFLDVKTSFLSALRRAGIRDFRFHDLRHTFASHLVMAGIDLATVRDLLGHKTLTMTLRYAHLAPSHKVWAVEALDAVMKGKRTLQKLDNLGERDRE